VSASAIYEGHVTHRRRGPVGHAFRYRMWMVFADLDELPGAFAGHPLWSARRRAPVRLRRSDYLGDPRRPLAETARELVSERLGFRPVGAVRLLTVPRLLGVGFNPVSFYFLYGESGNNVEAVIAEVTNTPWGERHAYVLDGRGGELAGQFDKRLHVSPFMPMEQTYRWRLTEPGERMGISIVSEEHGRRVFDASLGLRRRELSRAAMTRAMLSYPPAALATLARIYWNALRLKLKGARYHARPAAG
jgi:uncharacterized protein